MIRLFIKLAKQASYSKQTLYFVKKTNNLLNFHHGIETGIPQCSSFKPTQGSLIVF